MRVLLVEDEPETAKLLANGLSEASYSVDVALNGMDGGGPTEQDRSEPPNERGKSPWLLGALPSDSP